MIENKINESQSQEISQSYKNLSKEYNINLEDLVYGENGFMKTFYPNGFPDFNGDLIYSQKYWNEFEKWLSNEKGIILNNDIEEEYIEEDCLEETYSDDELDSMIGKVYNLQKISDWERKEKYGSSVLMAKCVCTRCGREKEVFLSNLVKHPEKYGSCICSDTNVDAQIDYAKELYTGGRKLSSNTSGYTGVSYVSTYAGQPYDKWRAYIEVDGKRTYLGDFDLKKDAIAARKEAAEKGVK